MSEKTWLHWSGETLQRITCVNQLTMSEKTWLHWSRRIRVSVPPPDRLTMSEKTWLHWSYSSQAHLMFFRNTYHVWKDMAPLKHPKRDRVLNHAKTLPCLKRHGSIEAPPLYVSVTILHPYHVWKDMAPLKRRRTPLTRSCRGSLPCLKRHGSIEAL